MSVCACVCMNWMQYDSTYVCPHVSPKHLLKPAFPDSGDKYE